MMVNFDGDSDLVLAEKVVGYIAAQLGYELRIGKLLSSRRSRGIWPLLGGCFALVAVMAFSN